MASRSNLSASFRTRECAYLFSGDEKLPFVLNLVRIFVTVLSEMPRTKDESMVPQHKYTYQ